MCAAAYDGGLADNNCLCLGPRKTAVTLTTPAMRSGHTYVVLIEETLSQR